MQTKFMRGMKAARPYDQEFSRPYLQEVVAYVPKTCTVYVTLAVHDIGYGAVETVKKLSSRNLEIQHLRN